MFSYRHGFHAGNHADVLKHMTWLAILRYMTSKPKPLMLVDTHAGAGLYSLEGGYAEKSGEYLEGIQKLFSAQADKRVQEDTILTDYLNCINSLQIGSQQENAHTSDNTDIIVQESALKFYPGSPWVTAYAMRDEDALRAFELHSTDFPLLAHNIAALRQGTHIQPIYADGFAGLKAFLPPASRRGAVLIDPSYENKMDYRAVVDTLKDACSRFSTGTYAVWYPLIARPEARGFADRMKKIHPKWLDVTLRIGQPEGSRLLATGMFVINPPWTLEAQLRGALPILKDVLKLNEGASWEICCGAT